jgi:hypothetical protein
MGDLTGGDDWIGRLREATDERLRVEQRRDRIEYCFVFLFVWFFISFWSLGIYELAFSDAHVTFRTTQGAAEAMGAATLGLLVTVALWPFRTILFPAGEPGLLALLDSRREANDP